MKKSRMLSLLILGIGLMFGTSSCSIEDKNIIEKIEVDDIASLIKKDPDYENIVKIATVLQSDEIDAVVKAKYNDVTYKNMLFFNQTKSDSNFIKKYQDDIIKYEDSLITIYKDSILIKKSIFEQKIIDNDPSKYFDIEFNKIIKTRYSYSDVVKDIYFNFKITPKERIEGGSFNYTIIYNATGTTIGNGGCRFSDKTSKPFTASWELGYNLKDEFESASTTKIKEKYSFIFKPTIVNVAGVVYKDYRDEVPDSYQQLLNSENPGKALFLSIILENDDSLKDYKLNIKNKAIENIDPKIYDLYENVSKEIMRSIFGNIRN